MARICIMWSTSALKSRLYIAKAIITEPARNGTAYRGHGNQSGIPHAAALISTSLSRLSIILDELPHSSVILPIVYS